MFFSSVLLGKGAGVNLRPRQRTFTYCWDNILFDKLSIFGLLVFSFFLTFICFLFFSLFIFLTIICWSCCLFYKFSSWFCFCFNLFLFIVFLFSWFLRFFFGFLVFFYKFERHYVPFVWLWNSSKKSASIGSSVESLVSVVVSVSDDANIGNNRSFVILSLSDADLMFLLVSSSLFLLRSLNKSFGILLDFLWTWFEIFMLL